MIIGPTLVIVVFCNLLVSSLITSVAANINKTYYHDHKAKEYSISASSVGFGGIGLMIGLLLFHKMYMNIQRIELYSLLWMWTILIILSVLTYYSYDRLTQSHHMPPVGKHVLNNTERKLAFAAFCISIIGLSVGITYVITTGINDGYFDNLTGGVFEIKNMFDGLFKKSESLPSKKINPKRIENIELNNLISSVKETSF